MAQRLYATTAHIRTRNVAGKLEATGETEVVILRAETRIGAIHEVSKDFDERNVNDCSFTCELVSAKKALELEAQGARIWTTL